jgi:flagellar hook-associated protein 2
VVQDDTALGVQTTQAGQNATFTVAGFSGTFQRESNTVGDVLTGVTLQLQSVGTANVTVVDDTEAITAKAKNLATVFNGLVTFVAGQSSVNATASKNRVDVGALAGDSSVRRTVDRLHAALSAPLPAATGRYVNLSSLGFATQRDGTVTLDEKKFQAALADDPDGVAAAFAGNGVGGGAAKNIQAVANQVMASDGALSADKDALAAKAKSLQKRIDEGENYVTAFRKRLEAQFNAMESLLSGLKQQGDFLASVFAKKS